MSEHLRIPFPMQGVHVDGTHGDQPPGTTPEAENVRSIDPVSGRSVGAQRSGLVKFLESPLDAGEPVAALALVARNRPSTTHTQLDETDNTTTTPGAIEPEWERRTPRGGPARAIALDSQGNVYALDGPSQLSKYNSDGVLVTQLSLPANANDTVAQRVAVGPDDAVYLGTSSLDRAQGRVWRYVLDDSIEDEERLKLAWTLTLDKGVVDLLVDGDLLVTVLDGEQIPRVELAAYVALASSEPLLAWRRPCPDPVNDLGVARDGGLLLSIGRNGQRGAGKEAPNALSNVTLAWPRGPMWSPHDLDQARERLFAWYDAKTIEAQTGIEDGDEVFLWPSRVNFDTTAGPGLGNYPSVYDSTDRGLRTEVSGGAAQYRHGPTYRATGAGGVPCIDFNADRETVTGNGPTGEVLFSGNTTSEAPKSAATDKLPNARSPIPGWINANFCLVMAVRVRRRSEIGVLLSHLGGSPSAGTPATASYGVVVNGEQQSSVTARIDRRNVAEGVISADVGSRSQNDYNGPEDFSYSRVSNGAGPSSTATLADEDTDDDTIASILALNVSTGSSPAAGSSVLRVNGVTVDRFTYSHTAPGTRSASTGGQGPTTAASYMILGSMSPRDTRTVSTGGTFTNVYGVTDFASFDGEVLEMLVVLGSSDAAPHDTPVTHPTYLGDGSDKGSESPILMRADSEFATEVELLEGYIAHANGLSHLLRNGFQAFSTTSGFDAHESHPFGGTGEYPVSPEWPGGIDAEQDLWSPDEKLAKINTATGGAEWVVRGGGVASCHAADEIGGIGTAGPGSLALPNAWAWSSRLDESETILRRIVDLGYTYDVETRAYGLIHVIDRPALGETLTVNDGTTSTSFVFVAAAPGAGEILRANAGDRNGQAGHIVTALTGAGYFAALCGHATVYVFADVNGAAGNNLMGGTAATNGNLFLVGLRDGRDGTGAWTIDETTLGDRPIEAGCRMIADQDADFHYALETPNEVSVLRKRDGADGSVLYEYDFGSPVILYGIAAPRRFFDWNPDSVVGPEFIYVGHDDGGDTAEETLTKLRLVAEEIDTSVTGQRIVKGLAVVDGSVHVFDRTASAVPTGGTAALDAGSSFIGHATLFGEVFLTDGIQQVVYKLKENEVAPFEPETGGEIPKGARLLAAWNGRLVAARTRDDAYGWHMSAKDNPYDWNLFPAVPVSTQAVAGAGGPVGGNPDIINALIPYSDDFLILGGDSSIRRLSGDPGFGGQIDLVSDITGIAFGRAWCKDPEGRLYFFGSRGGVYVMAPGGQPVRLSMRRIERRLQDIDLSAARVELVWNPLDEGLHVLVFNVGDLGEIREHWFWDAKNDAWWPDRFADPDAQPSAVLVFDGDEPDDRVLIFGGEDGYLRAWDRNAVNDDGTRIYSQVKVGPMGMAESPFETAWSHLAVTLDPTQGGALAEFLVGDTAAEGGRLVAEQRLRPGRNHASPRRAAGGYTWLRLANAGLAERWAFEAATIRARAGGRRRVRR